MRNFTIYLFAVFTILFSNSMVHAQSSNNALQYMNELMEPLNKTKDDTWQYLKAVTRGRGARKVESKRQNLLVEMKSVKYEIKRMGLFNSDASLKDAIVNYLDLSLIVMKEDFDKILDMEDIAEQSYDLMEAYLLAKEKANDKLDHAFDSLVITQKEFADKHDITLLSAEGDKTSERIKKANETLKYYNEIFLIFFKSNKQEVYVLDAMQRNDVNALEQNLSTLALYSNEGIEKLKSAKAYRGDASLKVAAQRMLRFYKKEAEVDFPAITDFYIKKDNLEKIQKSFDAKSKKSRTQEDVDQYNKAGQEYNQAAQKVTQIYDITNTGRSKNLDLWNSSVNKFFDVHSK